MAAVAALNAQEAAALISSSDSSSLARRGASGSSAGQEQALRPTLSADNTMFRSGKQLSGSSKLEPRHSDPLDPADSLTPVQWEREPILNLVTAVLSNCVLGFPFCFKTCGLGLAVLLVLVTLVAAELSMRLLLMSSQLTGKRSYEELARYAYGSWGHAAVQLSLVAMNVGSVVSYLLILTDTVSSVAGTVIPPGAEPSRNMMLGLITMCGCLPVALFVKSAQLLSAVNSVSMAFLLFFCCITALLPFSPTHTGQLLWWRSEGVLVAFPIVSYGFTAHQYLFKIYPEGQRPSMKKMTTAVQRGMVLSAAIYMLVGASGYAAFGSRTAGDVLRNFGGMGASGVRLHAERVLKYGFGLSLLGAIPLTLYPLHDTFAPWLTLCSPAYVAAAKQAAVLGADGVPLSPLQDSLLTTGILGASFALAVLLPNVEFVFGLAGSTASTLMAFILPAAIFLHVSGSQRGMGGHSVDMLRGSDVWRQRRRMAGALLLFGCVAGVLCTHALVVSIQEEKEVVQLAQELVREEAKVAVATHTEAKAKQVAEVVAEVARAKQELEVVKAEASGQVETLARTAEALNSGVATGWRDRQQQKGKAGTELAEAHTRVGEAITKLENVTANLGASASRMRNETATISSAATAAVQLPHGAATAAAGTAVHEGLVHAAEAAVASLLHGGAKASGDRGFAAHAGVVQAAESAVAALVGSGAAGTNSSSSSKGGGSKGGNSVTSVSTQATATAANADGVGAGNSSSSSSSSSDSGGSGTAAHEGVVRAAETAVATLVGGSGKDMLPGAAAAAAAGAAGAGGASKTQALDDDAAEALEKMAGAANATLTAVKQSKVALEAAAAEAASKGKTKQQARELGKAISQALNATTEAHARLNATAAALEAVEQAQTSELLGIVQRLAEEDEEEERQEERQAKVAQVAADARVQQGRKTGLGGAATGATTGASGQVAAVAGAASNATSASGKPRAEVREALKQAAAAAGARTAGNSSAVNVTAVAQAAIDAASTVVASSREKVEQEIEKKKPKVSERAIEIAKELVEGKAAAASAASSSSGTASSGGGAGGAAAGNATSAGSGGVTVNLSMIEHAASKHSERTNGTVRQRSLVETPHERQHAAALHTDASMQQPAAEAPATGDSSRSSTQRSSGRAGSGGSSGSGGSQRRSAAAQAGGADTARESNQ